MGSNLTIAEIEGIYQGETFSRKVALELDGIKQDLEQYSIDVELFEENDVTSTVASTNDNSISVDNSVISINSDTTKTMIGWYIMKVTFNVSSFVTIRKVRFRVER